jgi:hypothetical protein
VRTKRGRLAHKRASTILEDIEADWARTLGAPGLAALRQALEALYGSWRAEAPEDFGLGRYGLGM